jgi:hypothetical protein
MTIELDKRYMREMEEYTEWYYKIREVHQQLAKVSGVWIRNLYAGHWSRNIDKVNKEFKTVLAYLKWWRVLQEVRFFGQLGLHQGRPDLPGRWMIPSSVKPAPGFDGLCLLLDPFLESPEEHERACGEFQTVLVTNFL